MTHGSPPANQGFLIAPARERKNPAIPREALVPDIIDEAVDPLQFGPQDLRIAQVGIPLLRSWTYFEYHAEQRARLTSSCRRILVRGQTPARPLPAVRDGIGSASCAALGRHRTLWRI